MKNIALVCALLTLAVAGPAAAQQTTADGDRAYRLVGTWSCETAQHSISTTTYTRNDDGSVSMKNLFTTDNGLSGEFNETYRYDTRSNRWTWNSVQARVPNFKERGTAGPWTAEKWTFGGEIDQMEPIPTGSILPPRMITVPLRMVYTDLTDSTFRRDFETVLNDRWTPFSESTCKRVVS
jgi:hypothetical protein